MKFTVFIITILELRFGFARGLAPIGKSHRPQPLPVVRLTSHSQY